MLYSDISANFIHLVHILKSLFLLDPASDNVNIKQAMC